MHSGGRMQSFSFLKQVVYIVTTGFKVLLLLLFEGQKTMPNTRETEEKPLILLYLDCLIFLV
jgi:hypothetical protein